MAMVKLIPLAQCRLGGGTFVEHGGRELAVFRLSDPERIYVMDNACPHSGGNLSGGSVESEIVTCRQHEWKFELSTGVCTESNRARVRTYSVEVREGVVWVDLPE